MAHSPNTTVHLKKSVSEPKAEQTKKYISILINPNPCHETFLTNIHKTIKYECGSYYITYQKHLALRNKIYKTEN